MTADTVVAWVAYEATFRRCSKCKLIKPPDAFYWEAARRCEKGGYRPDCKPCSGELRKARHRARREAIRAIVALGRAL